MLNKELGARRVGTEYLILVYDNMRLQDQKDQNLSVNLKEKIICLFM